MLFLIWYPTNQNTLPDIWVVTLSLFLSLRLMKDSSEIIQYLPYFWNTKTPSWFIFSFGRKNYIGFHNSLSVVNVWSIWLELFYVWNLEQCGLHFWIFTRWLRQGLDNKITLNVVVTRNKMFFFAHHVCLAHVHNNRYITIFYTVLVCGMFSWVASVKNMNYT